MEATLSPLTSWQSNTGLAEVKEDLILYVYVKVAVHKQEMLIPDRLWQQTGAELFEIFMAQVRAAIQYPVNAH